MLWGLLLMALNLSPAPPAATPRNLLAPVPIPPARVWTAPWMTPDAVKRLENRRGGGRGFHFAGQHGACRGGGRH